MKFNPLADRVLVKRVSAANITAGGILIPDNALEKPQEGIVEAVGPGSADEPMVLKVGDHVLFGRWSGVEARAVGDAHVILKQSEVFGTLSVDLRAVA